MGSVSDTTKILKNLYVSCYNISVICHFCVGHINLSASRWRTMPPMLPAMSQTMHLHTVMRMQVMHHHLTMMMCR
jgi:hypothetical protein